MKPIAAIVVALLAMGLAGCGEGGAETSGGASAEEIESVLGPEIEAREGPPPEKLEIEDLKVGSGDVARWGDVVGIWYTGVDYRTGDQRYYRWKSLPPGSFQLGPGALVPGLDMGIEGMRVGGRREIVIPSHLILGAPAAIFVVQLAKVEPTAQTPPRLKLDPASSMAR